MRNLGVIALLGGWIVLTVWGILKGVLESRELVFSISIIVVWIGVLILLVSAIWQRYKESRNDPYKDVEI